MKLTYFGADPLAICNLCLPRVSLRLPSVQWCRVWLALLAATPV